MKVIKFNRSASNGNWAPSDKPVQGCHLKKVVHLSNSGCIREYQALVNVSDSDVFLKSGYNTTANGSCDDLILARGEGIVCDSHGSAYGFASYSFFKVEDEYEVAEPSPSTWALSDPRVGTYKCSFEELNALPIDWSEVIPEYHGDWCIRREGNLYVTDNKRAFTLDGRDVSEEYQRQLRRDKYESLLVRATEEFCSLDLARLFMASTAKWKWERIEAVLALRTVDVPWGSAVFATDHRSFDKFMPDAAKVWTDNMSFPRKVEFAQLMCDMFPQPTQGIGWKLIR